MIYWFNCSGLDQVLGEGEGEGTFYQRLKKIYYKKGAKELKVNLSCSTK